MKKLIYFVIGVVLIFISSIIIFISCNENELNSDGINVAPVFSTYSEFSGDTITCDCLQELNENYKIRIKMWLDTGCLFIERTVIASEPEDDYYSYWLSDLSLENAEDTAYFADIPKNNGCFFKLDLQTGDIEQVANGDPEHPIFIWCDCEGGSEEDDCSVKSSSNGKAIVIWCEPNPTCGGSCKKYVLDPNEGGGESGGDFAFIEADKVYYNSTYYY